MDAIIGKYKVRMEAHGLILTHPAGISFDLTVDEAITLMEYLKIYRQSIAAATQQQEVEEHLERIIQKE